ncbi:MAG: threonine-phosphate decarboxylase CobD [Pseudomonadota bacterium]
MSRDLIHGGALDAMKAAFPEAPQPWIDLSTGVNPWPYPDRRLSERALTCLPIVTDQDACKNAMASAIGAPADALLLAPGSELLIRLLPDIIHPRRVAILSPTYGDHANAWKRDGIDVVETPDPLSFADKADAVVITHPNNPDGRLFDLDALETAREKLAARGGWLIVDEAYADLSPEISFAPRGGAEGLVVFRSFGKFFGLPGLRLSGLIAPPAVRERMARRLGVWPASGAALEIGARAYADLDWQSQTRKELSEAADRLHDTLDRAGFKIVGGTALYRYVQSKDAHQVWARLAEQGVYVRRFDGSNSHLRFGLPPTPAAEARLAKALTL